MLRFTNSFSTDLIEIRCLHNDEKKLPGKFVVLDKMDAVAQAGHMTNEYSKYKAIHMFYVRPSKNNLCMLHALAVCSCSVLAALAAGKYEHQKMTLLHKEENHYPSRWISITFIWSPTLFPRGIIILKGVLTKFHF